VTLTPEMLEESVGISLWFNLFVTNLMLGCFNLLPAFPMDGGRVLRAVLALGMDRLRATIIASRVALVLAILLGVASYFIHAPMLIFLAAFVFFAGQQEVAALRYQEAQRRAEHAAARYDDADIIDAVPADEAAFSGFVWDGQARRWVVWRDGRPVTSFSARPE
jgi:hypothetical protein